MQSMSLTHHLKLKLSPCADSKFPHFRYGVPQFGVSLVTFHSITLKGQRVSHYGLNS